jgi:hypothetical protein
MVASGSLKQFVKQKFPFGDQIARQIQQWKRSRKKEAIKSKNSDIYSRILSPADSNALIAEAVAGGSPLMVSRFGDIEAEVVYDYLNGGYQEILHRLTYTAGIFPIEKEILDRYSQLFLESAKAVDILGVWFQKGEPEIIRHACPTASLLPLAMLEPYFHDAPWSRMLAGKRVLVVHPFAASITEQYNNHRKYLFQNRQVLPEFELVTVKAVQSLCGIKTEFETWFDAYDWMRNRVQEQEFDIAILGCGAYGLPLAAFIKTSLGKQSIHLGGATQVLFGIRGKRWDIIPFYQSLYNEYWVRPKPEETPKIPKTSYW